MDMNLLEYSRWGGSEPPEEVEVDGPLVRFSEYDTRYLILTDSAKTAADLSSQLSKGIGEEGEQMDFEPGDASDRPFSVKIGTHVRKIIKFENNEYEDDCKLQAVGLDSEDVSFLENSGFLQTPNQDYDASEAWCNSVWLKGKSFSSEQLDEKLFDAVSNLCHALDQLGDSEGTGQDEWQKQQVEESRSKIQEYLQGGANIHANEEQILVEACERGVMEVVAMCLEKGADVNAQDSVAVINAILGEEANPEIVELLIEHGADSQVVLDCRLVHSCREGDLESVTALMGQGARCKDSSITQVSQMPLNSACGYGHLEVVRQLVENDADLGGESALYLDYAIQGGFTDIVRYLIEKKVNVDADDGNPLRCAVLFENSELVKLLLAAGADPNLGSEVAHALHCVALTDQPGDPQSLSNRLEIAGLLIEGGSEIEGLASFENREETVELTPLTFAARNGELEIAQFLLEKGADVNGSGSSGALAEACKQMSGPERGLAVANLLLEAGADPNQPGDPLMWACAKLNKELIEALLAKGADPNASDEDGGAVLNVVKNFASAMQRILEAEEEYEKEEALQAALLFEDLSIFSIEGGEYPTWLMSTNDFAPEPGVDLLGLGLRAFRKPSKDCQRLQAALGAELEASSWAQYPKSFNPFADQILKSPERFQREVVQKNNNLLNVGLTLPIDAFAGLAGDSFAAWKQDMDSLPEDEQRDGPAKDLGERITVELNAILAEAGLPQCREVFTLPWVRVMFGSSLELGNYYVLFPEELYEPDSSRAAFHLGCGQPSPSGFATISY
tara:strand:+ start:567 stop:2942 length:2376 start_codon:yes stop_codon:yes gene_type:complete